MPTKGSLTDIPLAELLQSLGSAQKTGALFLYRGAEEAVLYLRAGRLVHAVAHGGGDAPPLEGTAAFCRAAKWRAGQFCLESGRAAPKETIALDMPALLLEAARREDEERTLLERMPPAAVPAFAEESRAGDTAEGDSHLDTCEWGVLSLVDGTRSVEEIARALGREVHDVCRALERLLKSRLIILKQKESMNA